MQFFTDRSPGPILQYVPQRETLSLHWLMRISSHSPMYHPHSYPGQCPPCVNQPPQSRSPSSPLGGADARYSSSEPQCLACALGWNWKLLTLGHPVPSPQFPLGFASQWGLTILVSSLQRYHSLTKSPGFSLSTEGSVHHAQQDPGLIPAQPYLS